MCMEEVSGTEWRADEEESVAEAEGKEQQLCHSTERETHPESTSVVKETQPQRLLRSDSTGNTPCPGRPHVLPVECVICKQTKYVKESVTSKRKVERLVRCETIAGGQLLNAALMRKDEHLLVHVRGRDLVALEVRYHRSCYLSYTRVVRTKQGLDADTCELYAPSYARFCHSIIDERILKGKEILRLTKLLKLFVRMVHDVEGLDASSYKTTNLKRRLQRSHRVLCFIRPTRQFESDLVFVESLGVEDVIEDAVVDASSEGSESERSVGASPSQCVDLDGLRTLYSAAQILKCSLDSIETSSTWPPTAEDLHIQTTNHIIPYQLFNFLAWSSGLSQDPVGAERVTVTSDEERRLLSIAQDIVYLKTKGRVLLPKHTSLAMAVRHFTGSAKLIGILNGLGHCVSNTMVLDHDTALAKRQLALGNDLLPAGVQSIFTTLVFDNNDFGEETISGKGSTHNTNGIIIQHSTKPHEGIVTAKVTIPKSRKRSFEAPPTDIKTFFGSKKTGPKPFEHSEDNFEKRRVTRSKTASSLPQDITIEYRSSSSHNNMKLKRKLLKHKRNVLKKRIPYKCDVCSKSFSASVVLNMHVRAHNGDRPHKCPECDKAYAQLHHLTTHMTTHHGMHLHKCSKCGRGFSMLGLLKKHMRSHMEPHPFKGYGTGFEKVMQIIYDNSYKQ
uniref:uncharacterized protein isoform X2 n=1 Tax=Myxine glutinosa TaxID=7769 RepID=UPI0035901801